MVSGQLSGVAGGRRKMKFKGSSEDRAWLLGHQHLETFLDGDSVSRVFVVRGEPSRMGRAGLLSCGADSSGRRPSLLVSEVMLEKHGHAEAEGSASHLSPRALIYPKR